MGLMPGRRGRARGNPERAPHRSLVSAGLARPFEREGKVPPTP